MFLDRFRPMWNGNIIIPVKHPFINKVMDINKTIQRFMYKTGDLFIPKPMKQYKTLFKKYKDFTMVHEESYISNLRAAKRSSRVEGDVVECGVWRGGMIAGIAEILGNEKAYHLFDSFEGLPEAKEIDGAAAIDWQKNTGGEEYYDNCKAEISFAEKAMGMAGVKFKCHKGWFSDTLPLNTIGDISLLRLDGDWYDSTMVCLQYLFPKVVKNGLVLIDDYYTWDGCSKAVHDYLSSIKSTGKIFALSGVAYIIKND